MKIELTTRQRIIIRRALIEEQKSIEEILGITDDYIVKLLEELDKIDGM